jgi:hypothetical protein
MRTLEERPAVFIEKKKLLKRKDVVLVFLTFLIRVFLAPLCLKTFRFALQ